MSKKLLPIALFSLVSVFSANQLFAQTVTFPDVSSSDYFSESVNFLKEENVIQGYSNGTFQPESLINRAEFVKILVAANVQAPQGQNCFPDVRDEWFAPYVCEAKNRGWISGYQDGNFQPSQVIKFSEAAKVLANVYQLPAPTNATAEDWYQPYVEQISSSKAIPLSIEYFDQKVDRAEMSEMVYRLKAKKTDSASRTYREIKGEGYAKANSCQDLGERLALNAEDYPIYYYRDVIEDSAQEMPQAAPTTSGSIEKSADHSTTNVQEEGVDEADLVKNDGKYIYHLRNNSLEIIQAYPASTMTSLAKFDFSAEAKDFYATELYLNQDQIVVVGTKNSYQAQPLMEKADLSTRIMPPYYSIQRTQVYLLDVKDRTKPKIERSFEVDGNLVSTRRIDNQLLLITNKSVYNYGTNSFEEKVDFFADSLPRYQDSLAKSPANVVDCNQIYLLPKPKTSNFLTVMSLPLDNLKAKPVSSVIVGSGEGVYATTDNLYLFSSEWRGAFTTQQQPKTKIYRLDLTKGVNFAAEGEVPGTVLNQFSLDQYRNHLRIATTSQTWDGFNSQLENQLYILDSNLKITGKLENLAPGEKIYSARLMGERGYLVTFKTVDPLFVLDLSDETKPAVLGELKIPGYSNYLHPYDENHIIGFGQDVTVPANRDQQITFENIQGLKMALFDVKDPKNPRELFSEIIGGPGTSSELLYNHKALLFDREKNLLAFPVSIYSYPQTVSNGSFIGAYVYGLDLQKGFQLKAKISHLDLIDETMNNYDYGWGYQSTIARLLYIGEYFYSVSDAKIQAHNLSDWKLQKSLVYAK